MHEPNAELRIVARTPARAAERAAQLLTPRVREQLDLMGLVVEAVVGGGTFGVVVRAHDRRMEREVAVKLIEAPLVQRAAGPSAGTEMRTLSALRHPHVVPLFNAGTLNDRTMYLVMPWIDGATLRHRLRTHGRLSVEQVVRIGIDLADALAALHEQGLVHRDVKPDNVMLEGDHAMLIDLGLVTQVREVPLDPDAVEYLIGTPAYMSPEQCRAGEPFDGRADLYALGCLLFELLAGEAPYAPPASERREPNLHMWTESLHTQDDIARWQSLAPRVVPVISRVRRDVPGSLTQLLIRLMQADRTKRPASARDVQRALQHIQADGLRGSSLRPTRAQGLVMAAAGMALVVMGVKASGRSDGQAPVLQVAGAGTLSGDAVHLDARRALIAPLRFDESPDVRVVAERLSAELEQALLEPLARQTDTVAHPVLVPVSIPVDRAALSSGVLQALRVAVQAERTRYIVAPRLEASGSGARLSVDLIDAEDGKTVSTLPPLGPLPTEVTDTVVRNQARAVARAVHATLLGRVLQ